MKTSKWLLQGKAEKEDTARGTLKDPDWASLWDADKVRKVDVYSETLQNRKFNTLLDSWGLSNIFIGEMD